MTRDRNERREKQKKRRRGKEKQREQHGEAETVNVAAVIRYKEVWRYGEINEKIPKSLLFMRRTRCVFEACFILGESRHNHGFSHVYGLLGVSGVARPHGCGQT